MKRRERVVKKVFSLAMSIILLTGIFGETCMQVDASTDLPTVESEIEVDTGSLMEEVETDSISETEDELADGEQQPAEEREEETTEDQEDTIKTDLEETTNEEEENVELEEKGEIEEESIDANAQEISDAVMASIDDRTEDEVIASRNISVSGFEVINEARKYVNKLKYVYGGTSLVNGADCSGFICRIYEGFGINLWKHRTQMYKYRTALGNDIGTDMNMAQAGDIVVYSGHVGLVTEKKTVINMQSSGCKEVSYTRISSWAGSVRCIIRPYGVSTDGTNSFNPGDTPGASYAAPTIDDVYVANINFDKGTYDVVAIVTAEAGLDRVQFPTWTEADGQDDLVADWSTNASASGTFIGVGNNQYKCRYIVRISDHNNERGKYVTHVHAYDQQGRNVSKACEIVNLSTDLILNQVSVTRVNATRGYNLWVEVISLYEIDKIEFLTWTDQNGRDDLVVEEGFDFKRVRNVADGTLYSDGYKVNIADHGNSQDIYHNAIKVYENTGRVTELVLDDVDLRAANSGNCGVEGSDLTWRLTGSGDNLSLYIEGTGDMPDNWLPDGADQNSNIVPWYASKSRIKRVYLPEGLTSIGRYAFSKTAITKINIPDSVSVIHDAAFLDCSGLSGVLELPSKLKSIGKRAFLGTNYDTLIFHSTGIRVPKYDGSSELIEEWGKGDLTAGFKPSQVESGYTEQCFYAAESDCTYIAYVTFHHFVDETKVTLLYPADGSNPTEYAEVLPWTDSQWEGYQLESIASDFKGFELEQYSLELKEGDQGKISVIFDVEDAMARSIVWTSANEDVAVVDQQGNVTAVKQGNTVITAKVAGTTQIQECSVFVKDRLAEEIKLNITDAVLCIGDTLQLIGEVLPWNATNKNITWYSGDSSVASVDKNGLVTAFEPGGVSIVAQTEDGEAYAYCDLKVLPDVEGVRLNKTDIILREGSAQTLFASVEPENAFSEGLAWSSADEKVATVINGKVVAVGAGTTWITASEKRKSFVAATCKVTVNEQTIAETDKVLVENGNIPQGIWVAGFEENKVYTGSAVKQDVRIYNGAERLVEKQDYTLTYQNNSRAGLSTDKKAPALIVNMKNNFSGKKVLKFNIQQADISGDSFKAEDLMIRYDGRTHKPVPVLTRDGKKLKAKKDYVVSYPSQMVDGSYMDKGMYEIVLHGTGNYTGQRTLTVTITEKKPLCDAVIEKIKNQTYSGVALEPEVKVTYKGVSGLLKEGIDYDVTYSNNLEVGKACVVITAKENGEYVGSKRVAFNIVSGNSISRAKVIDFPEQMPYTGEQQKPIGYKVQYNGELLREHEDFEVSYKNNINAGKATIIFTGIKHYKGTLKKTYRITALPVSQVLEVSGLEHVVYEKNGATPKPHVTHNGQMLREGVDYTLSYSNNKNVGEVSTVSKQPTVIIKGKGNYTGSTSRTFVIERQDVKNLTLTVADKVYTSKPNKWQSIPIVTDVNGKKLKAGTDYEKEIEYRTIDDWNDVPDVGTVVRVTITGKGAYFGTISGSYHIMEQSVSSAKVVIEQQEYTGCSIEPTKDLLKITVGKGKNATVLKENDYDIIDYQNNLKKGTGYIVIRGKGNYGGTKKISFKIGARALSRWWKDI